MGKLNLNNDSFNRGSDLKQWRHSLVGLQKANCYIVESPCARERWIASSCWVPQHTAARNQIPSTVSELGGGIQASDEIAALADTLIASWWDPEHKTELCLDNWPTEMWDDICVLFASINFVIIWYSANTSAYLWNVRDRWVSFRSIFYIMN